MENYLFIIHHIVQEPVDMAVWREIHPRIIGTSQGLFCDGYYDSAAEKAVKEVESRLRELFQILKPGVTVPAKVGDIIGALLSENGAYHIKTYDLLLSFNMLYYHLFCGRKKLLLWEKLIL